MNDAVDSAGVKKQPRYEASLHNFIFFVAFVLYIAFFTINIFIGVVLDTYNKNKNKGGSSLDAFITHDQTQYLHAMERGLRWKPEKAIPRPQWRLQALVFNMVTTRRFEGAMLGFVALNLILLAFVHHNQESKNQWCS